MILIVFVLSLVCFGACTQEEVAPEQQADPVSNAAPYAVLAEKAAASVHAAEKAGALLVRTPVERETSADLSAVTFYPNMAQPLLDMPPTEADELHRPWVTVSQDETTGLVLAAMPMRSATVELDVSLEDQNGQQVGNLSAEAHPIVFTPVSDRERQNYRMQGLWLADPGPVPAEEGHLVAWFIRLQTTPTAEPGEYTMKIEIPWGNETLTDNLRVTVLPIRLPDPLEHGYTFGVFCSGGNFNEQQFRQMKRRGLEAILFFWPGGFDIGISNRDGQLVLDLSSMDEMVVSFKKAGMSGPIVIALGNDSNGFLERDIAKAFDLPFEPREAHDGRMVRVASLDNVEFEQRIVEALIQLFEHAAENNWPEIVILPYDEPTERLMDEHRWMVRLFREHFPEIRLYGVTMNRLEWAEEVLDTDILVANGDWARIQRLAREHNKDVWFYKSVTAASSFGTCRARTGLEMYAYHPDGKWFWSYNFHRDDPWNEFDGSVPDSAWVICWPPLQEGQESVGTPGYEGLREGVNDVRYAMALEELLENIHTPAAQQIQQQYDSWREQVQENPPTPAELPFVRAQLIRWTLELMERPLPQRFEETFPAMQERTPGKGDSATPSGFAPRENEQT